MSKSVLISIQPKWCNLIAKGVKTVEIRKSRPKLETPFKVYIYCTKGKKKLLDVMFDGNELYGEIYHGDPVFIKGFPERFFNKNYECGNGKIIGEFICDKIYRYSTSDALKEECEISDIKAVELSCIPKSKISNYEYSAEGKENCIMLIGLYLWHISDLVIYDTPKELSEFGKSKPPQSWCYFDKKGE